MYSIVNVVLRMGIILENLISIKLVVLHMKKRSLGD
jgi:hypothetical protein